MISAGIEKFYTYAQFFSVLFLSLSILGVVLVSIYFMAWPPRWKRLAPFFLFSGSFVFFLFTELAVSLIPTHEAARADIILNCAAVFLVSRAFFLFAGYFFNRAVITRAPFICMSLEAAFFLACSFRFLPDLFFFRELTMDRVVPGPAFFLLISLSACWVLAGIWSVGINVTGGTSERRTAAILAISAVALTLAAFLLHHILPAGRVVPVFPPVVCAAAVLFTVSLVKYNLLGVLHFPLEGIAARTRMLMTVIDEKGTIVARNHDSYGCIEAGGALTAELLAENVCGMIPNSEERERFLEAVSGRKQTAGSMTLFSDGRRYDMVFRISPVLYLRRRVGYLLTFWDITEEESSIRELAAREEDLRKRYEELRMYSKTSLYHEAEKERERLSREINMDLGKGLYRIAEQVDSLARDPQADFLPDEALRVSRDTLERIREAVKSMKNGGARTRP